MIVDDEELLRNGLAKMIERMELPLTIIGAASDGAEALRMISEHEPNIVLTDIRMPNVDGLELIKHLSEHYAEVRTIILSGYDDFDYAKKAMRLGCKDYLVKPPDYAELRELLRKIHKEFAQEREKLMEEGRKSEIINRNQLLLKTDFLRKLVLGMPKVNLTDIKEQAQKLDIRFVSDSYSLALLKLDKRYELDQKYTIAEMNLFKYACWNIASEIMQEKPCFYDEQHQMAILLPASSSFEESCDKLQEIRRSIAHYLGLSVSAAISTSHQLNELGEAYAEARSLLELRLLREKSVLITAGEAAAHSREDIQPHVQQLRNLHLMEAPNEIDQQLKQWIESVKGSSYTPAALLRLKQELRVALIALFRKWPVNQERDNGMSPTSDWLEQMDLADSFSDCIEPALRVIEQSSRQEQDKPYQSQAVDRAIAYIRANYNRDINLTLISEHVNMNPAYFSVMFKKKTGLGVVEYITDIRMEVAKKLLLETEMKTYQIAEATGYNDPAYFSNTFKRHNGATPQEYRNRAAINSTRNP